MLHLKLYLGNLLQMITGELIEKIDYLNEGEKYLDFWYVKKLRTEFKSFPERKMLLSPCIDAYSYSIISLFKPFKSLKVLFLGVDITEIYRIREYNNILKELNKDYTIISFCIFNKILSRNIIKESFDSKLLVAQYTIMNKMKRDSWGALVITEDVLYDCLKTISK